MKKVAEFDNVVFAVCYKPYDDYAVFVSGPDDFTSLLYSPHFDDNLYMFSESDKWPTFPKETGIYRAVIEYWFEQGYDQGYRADSESTWTFYVKDGTLVKLA